MLNFFATQEKQAPNYNLEKSKEVWDLVQTKIDKGVISDQNLPRDKETKASCAGIQSDLSKTVNLPKYEGPGQVSSIMKVRRHTHNDQDQVRELPCWCRPQSRVERPPPRRRRGTSGSLSLRYHTHYCIVTQGVPKLQFKHSLDDSLKHRQLADLIGGINGRGIWLWPNPSSSATGNTIPEIGLS